MMMLQLMQVTLAGFALGSVGMMLANRRAAPGVARQRWIKLAVYFAIVHAVLGACAWGRAAVGALAVAIVAASTGELVRAWRRIAPPRPGAVWPLFALGSAGFLCSVLRLLPEQVAFVFVVVAAFDGFSQVVGHWLGRLKLAPAVSPNKTIEGVVGGVCAALAFAVALRELVPAAAVASLTWGAAIAASALAGDLAASWVKRRAGIKDYSAALPGQGGFLDRFNSFIAAGAVAGTLLQATASGH